MERVNEKKGLENLTPTEVTQIAAEALFSVYASGITPTVLNTVEETFQVTSHAYDDCVAVVDKLIERKYLMKTDNPKNEWLPEIAFGTDGLWLLEDAFGHGEDGIDSTALAERIFATKRFFE